jgi:hypothetical protein
MEWEGGKQTQRSADDWLDQEGSIKFVPVPSLTISAVWNLDV